MLAICLKEISERKRPPGAAFQHETGHGFRPARPDAAGRSCTDARVVDDFCACFHLEKRPFLPPSEPTGMQAGRCN
jgi:hypothetical protein